MNLKTGDMENNLDNYFKDKLRHREFELNEAHWVGAEQLLQADERRRRRRFLWWFGAAGLLMVAVVAGVLWYSEINLEETVTTGVAPEVKSGVDAGTSENAKPAEDRNIEREKIGGPAAENRESGEGGKRAHEVTAYNVKNTTPKSAPIAQEAGHSKGPEEVQSQTALAGLVATNSSKEITPAGAESHSSEAPLNKRQRAENLALLSWPSISLLIQPNPDLHLTSANEQVKNKSISIGVTASQLMLASTPAGGQSVIGFEAGVAVSANVKNGWFVASGLQYQRRTGTFEASKLTETHNYRFGLELASEQLRPSSLHYMQLPVKIGWQKRHHLLEGGFSLNYLAGIRGAKGSLEHTGDVPPKKEFVPSQKGWIAEDGYKKWHVTATAGYRYRVSRQLSFGLSANYTIGGILTKNYLPPTGNYLLKEDNRFYLSAGAVYFIK